MRRRRKSISKNNLILIFKIQLEQLQNKLSDKNISQLIRYIQVIIDSFELYDDIIRKKYFHNITFRLLPILQNIQKQVED